MSWSGLSTGSSNKPAENDQADGDPRCGPPAEPSVHDRVLDHYREFRGADRVEETHWTPGHMASRLPDFHIAKMRPEQPTGMWTFATIGAWRSTESEDHGLEIALAHARKGRRVFPIRVTGRPDGGFDKRPLVKWKAGATTDEATIRRWWRQWPDASVAWALPDRYVVLDVDDPAEFAATYNPLPDGPRQETIRGGDAYHVWHDVRVQHAPQLFDPADSPSDAIQKAIDDYRIAAMSSESIGTRALRPGPGVVRCIRHLIGRTRDGRLAINVSPGQLLRNESWVVRRWPSHFAPSIA